jgi:hypothetical protein
MGRREDLREAPHAAGKPSRLFGRSGGSPEPPGGSRRALLDEDCRWKDLIPWRLLHAKTVLDDEPCFWRAGSGR